MRDDQNQALIFERFKYKLIFYQRLSNRTCFKTKISKAKFSTNYANPENKRT